MTVVCWVATGGDAADDRWARAVAITHALRRRGATVGWVVSESEAARPWANAARVTDVRIVEPGADPLCVLRERARAADAIVIDVAQALSRHEVETLSRRWPVLLVENSGDGSRVADLVLAPDAGAGDPRWLTGAAFVPLRGRGVARGLRRFGAGGQPVGVVHLSDGHPGDGTLAVVDALGRLDRPRVVAHVIADPRAPGWAALPRLLGRLGFPPAQPAAPDVLATQLAAADFAVLSYGIAVYEAMAAGVPAIVISYSPRDRISAERLAGHGAVVALGLAPTTAEIVGAAAALAGDRGLRRSMARAGRALVDGHGAARVVERLVAVVDGSAGLDVAQ